MKHVDVNSCHRLVMLSSAFKEDDKTIHVSVYLCCCLAVWSSDFEEEEDQLYVLLKDDEDSVIYNMSKDQDITSLDLTNSLSGFTMLSALKILCYYGIMT